MHPNKRYPNGDAHLHTKVNLESLLCTKKVLKSTYERNGHEEAHIAMYWSIWIVKISLYNVTKPYQQLDECLDSLIVNYGSFRDHSIRNYRKFQI